MRCYDVMNLRWRRRSCASSIFLCLVSTMTFLEALEAAKDRGVSFRPVGEHDFVCQVRNQERVIHGKRGVYQVVWEVAKTPMRRPKDGECSWDREEMSVPVRADVLLGQWEIIEGGSGSRLSLSDLMAEH